MAHELILAVDDEPHILELIKTLLEVEGYRVLLAGSGDEALVILKDQRPDLVLLDMMMPEMSGREVCERIRRDPQIKSLKIAFLTVAKFSEIGKKVLDKLNVADYITKPFDNQELLNRIRKLLEEKR